MPKEELSDAILDRLGLQRLGGDVVEFGCGYGTFIIPAAKRTPGVVYALDIELDVVTLVKAKAKAAGMGNIRPVLRDFVTEGTGLGKNTAGYVMLCSKSCTP